jgi:hypothetical protein
MLQLYFRDLVSKATGADKETETPSAYAVGQFIARMLVKFLGTCGDFFNP